MRNILYVENMPFAKLRTRSCMKQPCINVCQRLRQIVKSHWALSTVVTTLIILVISVLLAGVVAYFAINVTSTRVQEESLALTKQHVWYNAVGETSQAAIMIINTGGRDIVIDKLAVRGQVSDWSKVFYAVTDDSIDDDLFYNSTLIDNGTITFGGSGRVFNQASSDLTLQSGKTLIIYIANPDSISVNDLGLTVSIAIITSQAMYYKKTNVQGAIGISTVSSLPNPSIPDEPGTSSLVIQYASAYNSNTGEDQVGMVLTNIGSSTVLFFWSSLYIDGIQQNSDSYVYTCINVETYSSDLPYYTGQLIQNYHLVGGGGGFNVAPGISWIVYFEGSTFFDSSDEGSTVEIKLEFSGQNTNTKHITVQHQT